MDDFKVYGAEPTALFTLAIHRGEGMCLIAMNWRDGPPPDDFVGFAIEYAEPGAPNFWPFRNRLAFTDSSQITDPNLLSSKLCPIQKFRWIHFPQNAGLPGDYTYRVTPVFMSASDEMSYGVAQTAAVALQRETYPGQLDIGFTRGFISSQAFVERYGKTEADVATLIPSQAPLGTNGLQFQSANPKAAEAYDWMGFEARKAILDLLDAAIADASAQVRVVAYDFNEAEVFSRIEQLGARVKIIIDDSGSHGTDGSAENAAATLLAAIPGVEVKRQKLAGLQHNKFILVDGDTVKKAVCGSTNFSWRAFFVQANNAVTVTGAGPIALFQAAFDAYWAAGDSVTAFEKSGCDVWKDLTLDGIDAKLTFSPHSTDHSVLKPIADDIGTATSSLLYSLAFLYETPGPIKTAITQVTGAADRFVYGISDKKVGGLDVTLPAGNVGVVYPEALSAGVPPPFSAEPTGGGGARMHHKFVVIDFDQPTARVYIGSFNFSGAADHSNGENLMVIRDRRATTAYAVEALSLFDHYEFRIKAADSNDNGVPMVLAKPPAAGGKPWFAEYYTVPWKIRDREIFSA